MGRVVPMRSDGHWDVQDTAAVASTTQPEDWRPSRRRAVSGASNGTDNYRAAQFAQHEHAGATWWVEAIHPWRYGWNEGLAWPLDAMENRNAQRP